VACSRSFWTDHPFDALNVFRCGFFGHVYGRQISEQSKQRKKKFALNKRLFASRCKSALYTPRKLSFARMESLLYAPFMPRPCKHSADSILRRVARDAEREAIQQAIASHGTRVAAAKALGITTQTLRQKLKK
jgi:DNA-binding NtrC family response regulator